MSSSDAATWRRSVPRRRPPQASRTSRCLTGSGEVYRGESPLGADPAEPESTNRTRPDIQGSSARPKPLVERGFWLLVGVCPQRDSNPCYRLERATSWAARRWGQRTGVEVKIHHRARHQNRASIGDRPGRRQTPTAAHRSGALCRLWPGAAACGPARVGARRCGPAGRWTRCASTEPGAGGLRRPLSFPVSPVVP